MRSPPTSATSSTIRPKNNGNSRSGTRSKPLLTDVGPIGVRVPRDRRHLRAAAGQEAAAPTDRRGRDGVVAVGEGPHTRRDLRPSRPGVQADHLHPRAFCAAVSSSAQTSSPPARPLPRAGAACVLPGEQREAAHGRVARGDTGIGRGRRARSRPGRAPVGFCHEFRQTLGGPADGFRRGRSNALLRVPTASGGSIAPLCGQHVTVGAGRERIAIGTGRRRCGVDGDVEN